AASWSLFCLALSPLIVVALSLLYPAGLRRDPHSFPTRRSSDLGEQQLLSIIIPLGLLIAFRVFPFADDLGGMDAAIPMVFAVARSEEHTSELQSRFDLVCRLLLEIKKN